MAFVGRVENGPVQARARALAVARSAGSSTTTATRWFKGSSTPALQRQNTATMNHGSRGWEPAGRASTFTGATSTADPCGSRLPTSSSRLIRSSPIALLSTPPPQTPSPQTRPPRPPLLQLLSVSGPTTGRGEPLKQLLSLPRLSALSSYDRLQAAGQCCRLFANAPPPASHAIASPPRLPHMVIVHSVNNGLLEPSLHSAYFRRL